MSSPTALPTAAFTDAGLTSDGLWHSSFRSMASPVRVQLGPDTDEPERMHERVRTVFNQVDRECTRFDPDSDLMRANAAADEWAAVGWYCFDALRAARHAHLATQGRFDPRVLRTLVELGYDATPPPGRGPADIASHAGVASHADVASHAAREPWEPEFDAAEQAVRIGPEPVDLGGIGKGLALRWAGDLLRTGGCTTFLIDAGGDCIYSGAGPDGTGWRIGVEDPAGGADPLAVLTVDEGACATSSVRLLSWRAGERTVHHLIDPRTGRPGGAGLRSVTVRAADPASAEVWSKVLFLEGVDLITTAAKSRGLAALWVCEDGTVGMTSAMRPSVLWERS